MDTKSVLKEALQLRPAKRLQLIEMLTRSLNKPDEILKRYGQKNPRKDIKLWKKVK